MVTKELVQKELNEEKTMAQIARENKVSRQYIWQIVDDNELVVKQKGLKPIIEFPDCEVCGEKVKNHLKERKMPVFHRACRSQFTNITYYCQSCGTPIESSKKKPRKFCAKPCKNTLTGLCMICGTKFELTNAQRYKKAHNPKTGVICSDENCLRLFRKNQINVMKERKLNG